MIVDVTILSSYPPPSLVIICDLFPLLSYGKLSRELSYYIHPRRQPVKYIVSVAIREPVLRAAQPVPVTDGGTDVDACENGQKNCCGPQGEELPCFECWRSR